MKPLETGTRTVQQELAVSTMQNLGSVPDKTLASRSARRRIVRLSMLLGVLAASVALGLGIWHRESIAAPPLPDLDGLDPAIKAAIEFERAAVAQLPRSGAAWGHLGMVFFAHGFNSEAGECLAQAELLDPREMRWPYFQAVALYAGDVPLAIQKLKRTLELDQDHPEAPRLRLAELLLLQGRIDEASEHFRLLVAQNPHHARGHLGLARVAAEKADLPDALRHLTEAC